MSINFTSRVYIAIYIRRSFESLHRCQNPRVGLLCLSSLVNPYPEFNNLTQNEQNAMPGRGCLFTESGFRVGFPGGFSSCIFELGYFWRDFLAGFPIACVQTITKL